MLQSASYAVKTKQTQARADWVEAYTDVRYTCKGKLIATLWKASTEEDCKAACKANEQCTAVFHIHGQSTEAKRDALKVRKTTKDHCLLYDKCDQCRVTTFFGTTFQTGLETCDSPPAMAYAPIPPKKKGAPPKKNAPPPKKTGSCVQLGEGGTWDNDDLEDFYACLADNCIDQTKLWDGVTCQDALETFGMKCDDAADLSGHPADEQNTLFIGSVGDACPIECNKCK